MRPELQRLIIGWSYSPINDTQPTRTVDCAQPKFEAAFLWRQHFVLILFSIIFPLCLPTLFLPVAATTTIVAPVFVDETQNSKAMGYTDSRKIVRDSQGNLYVAYRKKYKQYDETAYHIFVAQSIDNGAHWRILNSGQPIETVGDFNQRVPAIAVDLQDVLHVVWYGADGSTQGGDENQIKYVRSTDYGESWSTWQNVSFVTGYAGQELWQEHPTIFVDNTNTLYIVWEGRDDWYSEAGQIKFAKSVDGGLSWTPWLNIAPSANSHSRPSVVATTDNSLYVFAYGSRNGLQQILYSYSDDGGAHWSRWRQVAAARQDQRHVSAAVDQAGRIHIVWRQLPFAADSQADQRTQIYYASFDGNAWSLPIPVGMHADSAQTYPSIAIDNTNTLWITWMETTDPYNFPNDAPTTGSIYYVVKTAAGWSIPLLYAKGGNNLYPSLRRNLTSSLAQIDVVWLETWSTGNTIRFAQLTRPTHFVPAAIMAEHPHVAQSWSARITTELTSALILDTRPSQTLVLGAFFQIDQLQRDLRAIVTLVVIVSLYVIIKFFISRWLAVALD